MLVELELGRVDDDVGALQLAELAQLGVRERRLRRPAAAEQITTSSTCAAASASIAWSAVSVGASSSGSSTSMRATSIATLPLPTTTARVAGEVELVVGAVRVAVVPGDELGGGVRARAVLAGDPEPVVAAVPTA